MSYAAQVRTMTASERFELVNALLAISIQRHGPLVISRADVALELMGAAHKTVYIKDLPNGDFEVMVHKQ